LQSRYEPTAETDETGRVAGTRPGWKAPSGGEVEPARPWRIWRQDQSWGVRGARGRCGDPAAAPGDEADIVAAAGKRPDGARKELSQAVRDGLQDVCVADDKPGEGGAGEGEREGARRSNANRMPRLWTQSQFPERAADAFRATGSPHGPTASRV